MRHRRRQGIFHCRRPAAHHVSSRRRSRISGPWKTARTAKPLARTEYRGVLWSQNNTKIGHLAFLNLAGGRDWTPPRTGNEKRPCSSPCGPWLYLVALRAGGRQHSSIPSDRGRPVRRFCNGSTEDKLSGGRSENDGRRFADSASAVILRPEKEGCLTVSIRLARREGPGRRMGTDCEAPKRYPISLRDTEMRSPKETVFWNSETELLTAGLNGRRCAPFSRRIFWPSPQRCSGSPARIGSGGRHSRRRGLGWAELGKPPGLRLEHLPSWRNLRERGLRRVPSANLKRGTQLRREVAQCDPGL